MSRQELISIMAAIIWTNEPNPAKGDMEWAIKSAIVLYNEVAKHLNEPEITNWTMPAL